VAERLEVHLVTPQREVWSGEATLVVARGTEGELGIQKGHAPMLIRLDVGVLRVLRGNEEVVRAVVDGGFMHVTTSPEVTRVDVLADDAELAHEVDMRAAAEARADAQARIERQDNHRAQVDLKKALVRLRING
jgi:F-type H+-transporting ATPase subunit epsilon